MSNKYPIGGYAPGEYNPIGCEHKLPNGFTAWSFQSEEQSNLGGQHKVSIHVCLLCGEINIGGYRPSNDEKHVNRFHEKFHIYHPDAIDAIIKQANFFNEESKWGRVSEKPAGSVWVRAVDRLPGWDKMAEWRFAGKEPTAKETVRFLISAANLHQWEWLDESGTASNKETPGVKAMYDALTYIYGALIDPVTAKRCSTQMLNKANQAICKYEKELKEPGASNKDAIDPQELWDKHSECIDDGRTVMTKDEFIKALATFKK